MPAFVILTKFTEQGLRSVKDTVNRAQAFRQGVEEAGGRVIGIWWLMGEFDTLLIFEMPDDETAMQALLVIGMAGNVRTQTLQAFSEEEVARMVERLP